MIISTAFRPFAPFAACLMALAGCNPAMAASVTSAVPTDGGPQATTALYHDWQLHCVTASNHATTSQRCEIAGAVPTANGKGVAARVIIGQRDPKKPAEMVIQLALGVWLPDGASLTVPGLKAPVRAEFKQCVQVCFAQANLDDATIAAMLATSKAATLAFTDGAKQVVDLPLSFNGFKAAFEANRKATE